jgi:hypothetical protein
MALDPSIALGVRPLEVPNQLAQYGQLAQIQNAQRQGEVAQMQLEQLKQDRVEMLGFQKHLADSGGNPDLKQFATMLLKSPKHYEKGVEMMQKLQEQERFETTGRRLYPELFGAAPAGAMPMAAPTARPSGALGSGTFGMMPEPVNNLAPAPVAPSNALVAPAGKTPDQLRKEIILFGGSNAPGAKNMVDMLKAQLTESIKQTDTQREMQGLGLPLTPEGFKEYKALSQAAPQPVELTRAMADRDKLIKLGRPANDPDVMAYTKLINKLTTHTPGTSVTMVGEKAESGEFGKLLVSQFADLSKAANLAAKTLPSIDANLNILNKGFETGFGTESKAAGAKLLAALGVDSAEQFATNAQVFQAKAAEAVLQKQLEQKGPQTQSDRELIEKTGAQLGATSQGNKFLLTVAKEQLKRDIEQREFYATWRKINKTFNGAEDAWFAGEGGKSLFDRSNLKTYLSPTSAANMIPGQGSAAPAARTVVRTGTLNGRRVIQYSDGSTEYGN